MKNIYEPKEGEYYIIVSQYPVPAGESHLMLFVASEMALYKAAPLEEGGLEFVRNVTPKEGEGFFDREWETLQNIVRGKKEDQMRYPGVDPEKDLLLKFSTEERINLHRECVKDMVVWGNYLPQED